MCLFPWITPKILSHWNFIDGYRRFRSELITMLHMEEGITVSDNCIWCVVRGKYVPGAWVQEQSCCVQELDDWVQKLVGEFEVVNGVLQIAAPAVSARCPANGWTCRARRPDASARSEERPAAPSAWPPPPPAACRQLVSRFRRATACFWTVAEAPNRSSPRAASACAASSRSPSCASYM